MTAKMNRHFFRTLLLSSILILGLSQCSSSKDSSTQRPRSKKTTKVRSPKKTETRNSETRQTDVVSSAPPSAGRQRIFDYVEQYQEIARMEMQRTGIPASIKLGQAILESDAGRSELARNAHNHFGIKCSTEWNGPSYYKKDDDRKNGRLVKSCFRKYDDPRQSFKDHSAFLMDTKKAKRYGGLFKHDSDDYKSWAKGLQKSGYATNKSYAKRLISVIEKYQLNHYDAKGPVLKASIPTVTVPSSTSNEYKLYTIQKGDSLYAIARKHKMSVDLLKEINLLKNNTIHPGEQLKVTK